MRVAVAGGTGVLGHHIVEALQASGHEGVAVSRSTGVDLITGTGLDGALDGVEVVIDASNPATMSRRKATAFFETATGNLHAAARRAGVSRTVVISIVGIDRLPGNPYYAAKLAHEDAARRGPLPVTFLRATQFHEFPAQVIARTRLGPVAFVPRAQVQTVAARSVGRVAAHIAVSPPDEETVEVAGPGVDDLARLAAAVVRRRGLTTRIVAVPIPGGTGRKLREGVLTLAGGPTPPSAASPRVEGPSFDEWLTGPDVERLSLGARRSPG